MKPGNSTHTAHSEAVGMHDISIEEAADWVVEEFHALGDIHQIAARIREEEEVISTNADKATQFPNAHFAHERLLAELKAEFSRMTIAMLAQPRVLH